MPVEFNEEKMVISNNIAGTTGHSYEKKMNFTFIPLTESKY